MIVFDRHVDLRDLLSSVQPVDVRGGMTRYQETAPNISCAQHIAAQTYTAAVRRNVDSPICATGLSSTAILKSIPNRHRGPATAMGIHKAN